MQLLIGAALVEQRARDIRLLLLDVDGVLTDGRLYFSNRGEEMKVFNSLDGHGIRTLIKQGIDVGIISGRMSAAVGQRATDLGLTFVYQGQNNKLEALENILSTCKITSAQIAYVGDDVPDLDVMKAVGIGFAVANAHKTVRQQADCITSAGGGCGAVREICDFLMQCQGS